MLPYPSVFNSLSSFQFCFFPSKLLCFHVANNCPVLTSGIQAQNQKALSGDRTLAPKYSRYRERLFQDHNVEGVFVIPVINLKPVFKKTDTHRKKKKMLSLGLLNVEN